MSPCLKEQHLQPEATAAEKRQKSGSFSFHCQVKVFAVYVRKYIQMCVHALCVVASQNTRLVGGSSPCSGTLEQNQGGEWRKARAKMDEWSVTAAGGVCKELNCGVALSTQMIVTDEDRLQFPFQRVSLWINCSGAPLGSTVAQSTYTFIFSMPA